MTMKATYANAAHTDVILEIDGMIYAAKPDDPRLQGQAIAPFAGAVAIPQAVSAFQLQEALIDTPAPAGSGAANAYEAVEAAVQQLGGRSLRAWQKATTYERASPTVAELAQAFGWTDAQVDDLFIRAAAISA